MVLARGWLAELANWGLTTFEHKLGGTIRYTYLARISSNDQQEHVSVIYFVLPPTDENESSTYVPLPCPTREFSDWCERNINPADICEFDPTGWNHSLHHLPAPYFELQPVLVGSLYWPTHASAFGVGYILATQADLDLILPAAFTADGPQPLTLVFSEETSFGTGNANNTVTATVYMLPQRPLAVITSTIPDGASDEQIAAITAADAKAQIFLVTVVDQRYFWWYEGENIEVVEETTTWQDLIEDIATALGVTINGIGSISADYGTPSNRFTAYNQPLPLLLDAVLNTIGMNLVVGYDGTLTAQDYPAAVSAQDGNFDLIDPANGPFYPLAGGDFAIAQLAESVPARVRVVFSRKVDGAYTYEPYVVEVTLTSLSLEGFEDVTGFDGAKVLMGDQTALITGVSAPSNLTDLEDYANAIATSYYQHWFANYCISFSGIAKWTPTGLSGAVLVQYSKEMMQTRVLRESWTSMDWGMVRLSTLVGMASAYPNAAGTPLEVEAVGAGGATGPFDTMTLLVNNATATDLGGGVTSITIDDAGSNIPGIVNTNSVNQIMGNGPKTFRDQVTINTDLNPPGGATTTAFPLIVYSALADYASFSVKTYNLSSMGVTSVYSDIVLSAECGDNGASAENTLWAYSHLIGWCDATFERKVQAECYLDSDGNVCSPDDFVSSSYLHMLCNANAGNPPVTWIQAYDGPTGYTLTFTFDPAAKIVNLVGSFGSSLEVEGKAVYTPDQLLDLGAQTSIVASHAATLTNAPTAGDPSFWIYVKINGSDYAIPAWSV